jgi:hypothetical protein
MMAAISPLPEMMLVVALRKREYWRALRLGGTIAATVAVAEFGMRRARFPKGSGLFFPVGTAAMLAIFVNSLVQHRTGRIHWRGRTYPPRQ